MRWKPSTKADSGFEDLNIVDSILRVTESDDEFTYFSEDWSCASEDDSLDYWSEEAYEDIEDLMTSYFAEEGLFKVKKSRTVISSTIDGGSDHIIDPSVEVPSVKNRDDEGEASAAAGSNCNMEWDHSTNSCNHNIISNSSGAKSWTDIVEEEEQLQNQRNSIWDNFDISKTANAGFKLVYVKPKQEEDIEVVEIELADIETEEQYWKNAIVCYVLGAYPPFEVMKGYIQRLWSKHGIIKISMMKNGVVLVRFDTEEGKNEAVQGGIFHFDNKPFIVKAWSHEMEFTRDELLTVPIWIRFPGLDFKYWSQKGLSKLGSLIGKPLMVDQNTERMMGLNYKL
ncbi:hypothetical protein FXO38_11988 [Capsicum annuum]|nr:hypothetical protein FXO38_11988 [Capsicum annuum]